MVYAILFTPRARENLKTFRKRDQQAILDAVEEQLTHQPHRPTKKRKRLEENSLAPWELRLGDWRVFYDILDEENRVVVLAVGRKERNKLFIGGEEVTL